MHPAILFLVIRFRLISYAAFKVHRQYIGIRDILSLCFPPWEMSEDSKHLISPVSLQRFIRQCNESEHGAANGHQRCIALPIVLEEDELCILGLCFE